MKRLLGKRLLGVMILSGVPVACGTSTPSAPDVASLASDASDASVSSLAQGTRPGPRPTCAPRDRSNLKAIAVRIVAEGKGFVSVRAISLDATDPRVPTCVSPTWSVRPSARIVASEDAEEATIFGTTGKYVVTARTTTTSDGARLSAHLKVVIH